MLTYSMENRENESIYEYLYNCIKRDIISKKLKPNEKLPSKRTFANNHGISVVTVENTYGQLNAEGYIYSVPKSGYYVSEIESLNLLEIINSPERTEIDAEKAINRDVRIGKSVTSKSNEQIDEQVLYDLASNHTIPDNFPFSIWAKLVRGILTEQDNELMISPPAGGAFELREAIAKHLRDFRGIVCDPEQIIVGAGTEYLYGQIVQLLGRNLIYGLEDPSSKKIRNIYKAQGVNVVPLSMDDEGIILTPSNLENVDIIQISPSHHFPTGIVTSVGRRYGLLQWVSESDKRYIIEDDYDSEFRLRGKPIPSLFSMDNTNKVIYFNTFAKTLSSTIRISYMVLPHSLLEIYYQKLGFYSCTVSNFEQYTLARFINNSYFEKHINRMRNSYRESRDILIEKLKKSILGPMINIKEEDSGLHFLLEINVDANAEELKQSALREGIKIGFLSDYYDSEKINKKTMNTAIVNYSGIKKEEMDDIVLRMCKAWCK